jgi:hypothetical protein
MKEKPMRFSFIDVSEEYPLQCSVCDRVLPDDTISCGDILYFPTFGDSDSWQPEAIKTIWGVDPFADFGVCEACLRGHCGAVPELAPDDWLNEHLERHLAGQAENQHRHEWVVFSTAIEDGCLMLQCVECGLMGTVDDPTREEWADAFHSPSRPYRWSDEARVRLHGKGPFHVVRAERNVHRCDCPSRTGTIRKQEYERFPAEIMAPDECITPEARKELEDLAELVSQSDLCSKLFPYFLLSYQSDTGTEPSGVVKRIASRIEQVDSLGLHCSPSVVARVLREFGKG